MTGLDDLARRAAAELRADAHDLAGPEPERRFDATVTAEPDAPRRPDRRWAALAAAAAVVTVVVGAVVWTRGDDDGTAVSDSVPARSMPARSLPDTSVPPETAPATSVPPDTDPAPSVPPPTTVVAPAPPTSVAEPTTTPSTTAPPVAPTVTLRRGDPVDDETCSVDACAYLAVELEGFSPGDHEIDCFSSRGGQWNYGSATVTEAGGQLSCWYGYAGETVWVEVGGVRSNDVVW